MGEYIFFLCSLQGHRNSRKSQSSVPSHKFSMKRATTTMDSSKDDKANNYQDPNKLLFVSEVE